MARKIGFTGTHLGMTSIQENMIRWNLQNMMTTLGLGLDPAEEELDEFHHGDCVGADEQAHFHADLLGLRVVIHPPSLSFKRAFCKSNWVLPTKPYLIRNQDIVNAVDHLLAAPDGPEKLRSGTWHTIRYARKLGKNITIIYPDGRINME